MPGSAEAACRLGSGNRRHVAAMAYPKWRTAADEATAGDIVAITGLPDPEIGDTVACSENPVPLERISVDEPTLTMLFTINSSPLAEMG